MTIAVSTPFPARPVTFRLRIGPRLRGGALLVAAALLAVGPEAAAHSLWLAERAGEWTFVVGEGGLDEAYDPAMLSAVTARGADGSPIDLKTTARPRNVVTEPTSSTTTVTAIFDDGNQSLLPGGRWAAGSRREHPEAVRATRFRFMTRTAIAAGGPIGQRLGHPLEIVPEADPLALKIGDSLPIRVYFGDRPLVGARIARDYLARPADKTIVTDAEGRAVIPVASAGLNVIQVSHRVATSDRPGIDEDGYSTTLAFTLGHH